MNIFVQENTKLRRELGAKEVHMSTIRSTLEKVLKNDADFCVADVYADDSDVINDDNELVEMVNSILCQFAKSKQRHLKDIQNCLVEMTDLQKKKTSYKKLGLKMKDKVKVLEDQNEDLQSKLDEKNRQLEHEIAEKNSTKSELENNIRAKEEQISSMTEQFRTKHEQFQLQINQLKGGIETKLQVVKNDKNRLAEIQVKLRAEVSHLEVENKQLKFVEMNLRNEVTLLEAKVMDDKLNVKVKVLEDQIENKDKEIDELKQKIELESEKLNAGFKREKMELEKMSSALEKEVKMKEKAIHGLQLQLSNQKWQRDDNADPTEKTRKSDNNEIAKLKSELKEKNFILEVLQRDQSAIQERSKCLSEALKQKDAAHHKAMTQHKLSLEAMKEQVISRQDFKAYLPWEAFHFYTLTIFSF